MVFLFKLKVIFRPEKGGQKAEAGARMGRGLKQSDSGKRGTQLGPLYDAVFTYFSLICFGGLSI